MHKVTIKASSDVALIKYWGKKDEQLRLPENGSISIILEGLDTYTTVEFNEQLSQDDVLVANSHDQTEDRRVVEHLNRIRSLSQKEVFAKVRTRNTFPAGTGLSSSGSGFAALTIAAVKALDLQLNQKELSILARQGSGTACRCVCGGFVEWKDGVSSADSYAVSLFSKDYWPLVDVIAIVGEKKKEVSSTEGHTTANTSAFFSTRLLHIKAKIKVIKTAIEEKNFSLLGETCEKEALEFHSILLTSNPPILAWYPGTIEVMKAVWQLRSEGIEAYFTINTGFNIHVLTHLPYKEKVIRTLESLPLVERIILTSVGNGPQEVPTHLF